MNITVIVRPQFSEACGGLAWVGVGADRPGGGGVEAGGGEGARGRHRNTPPYISPSHYQNTYSHKQIHEGQKYGRKKS